MTERKRKLDVFTDAPPAANGAAGALPTVNPFTGRAYSTRYYDILAKRRGEAAQTVCFCGFVELDAKPAARGSADAHSAPSQAYLSGRRGRTLCR